MLDVRREANGFVMEKVPTNPDMITRCENTIKIIRTVRCKNENIHGALKQKFSVINSVVPLVYLEPIEDGNNVSKYDTIAAVCCSLLNSEHPGFPVNFLKEDQKVTKATQMLLNFNSENFLQHIKLEFRWREVKAEDIYDIIDVPTLTPASFDQIFEVTSSIHALVKGRSLFLNPYIYSVLQILVDWITQFFSY